MQALCCQSRPHCSSGCRPWRARPQLRPQICTSAHAACSRAASFQACPPRPAQRRSKLTLAACAKQVQAVDALQQLPALQSLAAQCQKDLAELSAALDTLE